MSGLHQVLSEYSVPLQVWLAPEARNKVADILVSTLGHTAKIHTDPIPQLDALRGPAVLVLAASELNGPNHESLRELAARAHPGRSVLIGGTSDRDTLMDAINNWGVVRVIRTDASDDDVIAAIRAASAYLNREVAMETAIEDLDIETTMISSAIDQIEGSRERIREVALTSTATTFASGLMQILSSEQKQIAPLAEQIPAHQRHLAQHALMGMDALMHILERTLDYAIEKSAGIAQGEPLDDVLSHVRTLCGPNLGGHLGSGARIPVDPFALFHFLLSACRTTELGQLSAIDSHRSGSRAMVTLHFDGPLPEAFETQLTGPAAVSQSEVEAAGGQINAASSPEGISQILLSLPATEANHA
jgi:DNA-binding NarL/FixJ family response regulator